MFYDVYAALCQSIGKSPSAVAQELQINKSNVSNWKNNGYTPRGDVLNRIAGYFGVTLDYLLGNSQTEVIAPENQPEHDVIDSAFFRVMQDAQDRGFSPEDLRLALDFLEKARKWDQEE